MRILKGEEICLIDVSELDLPVESSGIKAHFKAGCCKGDRCLVFANPNETFPFWCRDKSQRFHSNTQLSGMCLSGLISDGFYTKHTAGKLSSHSYISCGFESIMKHSQIAPQNCTRVRIVEKPGQCSKNWLCKAADTTNTVNFKRERKVWRRKEEEKGFQNISNEACLTIIAAGGEADFKCENI